MAIEVFTRLEKSTLDLADVNITGRYLLCCIYSSATRVTLDELAEYVGMEKEGLRKIVKRLADIGVVKVTHRHKQPMLIGVPDKW